MKNTLFLSFGLPVALLVVMMSGCSEKKTEVPPPAIPVVSVNASVTADGNCSNTFIESYNAVSAAGSAVMTNQSESQTEFDKLVDAVKVACANFFPTHSG